MFSIFRLIKALYVLTRYGIIANLLNSVPDAPNFLKALARIFTKKSHKDLVKAIDKLGPSYIKLAQFLATRPDIVGTELSERLGLLQDRLEPFSKEQAMEQIALGLHIPKQELAAQFLQFSDSIAAASIAQVHKVQWVDKKGVIHNLALKIVRPNVKERFSKDIKSFYRFAKLAENFSAKARRLRFTSVVQELELTTKKEMDMRLEAAAISEMHDNIIKDQDFGVPQIYWGLTSRNSLAMEWIDGTKIANKTELLAKNFDTKLLAKNLMQAFLRHALRDGFFHADMHPGNLFVDDMGTIIAVDFGITARLTRKERFFLAQILYGFLNRDYMMVAQAHFDAGYVPKHHKVADFAQANRAIGEPIHGQKAKNIPMANLLTLLFEITEIFDMQTQPSLLLLQKNMVIVEGVARKLDHNFNMWQVAKPIVEEWMKQNIGIKNIATELTKASKPLLNILYDAPNLLENWREAQTSNKTAYPLNLITNSMQKAKRHIIIIELSLISIAGVLSYLAFKIGS